MDSSAWDRFRSSIRTEYDKWGRIIAKDGMQWEFADHIQLATCYEGDSVTWYHFTGMGVCAVRTPEMTIRYDFAACRAGFWLPSVKHKNGRIAALYNWDNHGRLEFCRDMGQRLEFFFDRSASGALQRVHIQSLEEDSHEFVVTCSVECDHLGTPLGMTAQRGRHAGKLIWSEDSQPWIEGRRIHLPMGLAGGLRDIDTGLVRIEDMDYFPRLDLFMALRQGITQFSTEDVLGVPYSRIVKEAFHNTAEFIEEEHPRDAEGKFTSGSGSSTKPGVTEAKKSADRPKKESPEESDSQEQTTVDVPEVITAACAESPWEGPGEDPVLKLLSRRERLSREHLTPDIVRNMSGLEVAEAAVYNFFPSLVQYGSDIAGAVWNWKETLAAFGHIVNGMKDAFNGVESESRQYWEAVCEYLSSSYGSFDAIKYKLATDPVALVSDASLFLTMGGGVLVGTGKVVSTVGKVAAGTSAARAVSTSGKVISQVGRGALAAGDIIDPLRVIGKPIAAAGGKVGKGVGATAGGRLVKGAGDKAIRKIKDTFGEESFSMFLDTARHIVSKTPATSRLIVGTGGAVQSMTKGASE